MEIEVAVPVPSPSIEFSFDSGTSTPYITAPSSPQRFGTFYFTNTANDHYDLSRNSFSISPSLWEENPGTSGSGSFTINSDYEDFEFEFKLERDSASADELFDKGKIKPLEPPEAPKSHLSTDEIKTDTENPKFLRVSDILAEQDDDSEIVRDHGRDLSPISSSTKPSNSFASFLSSFSLSRGYRKWSFKDFLLFRSASEGRGTSKDPLRKFAALQGDQTRPGLRTVEASGVGSVSSRRRGNVSAHELHYTANRAAAEDMKRKTFLPYRQGVLGCLGLNPNAGAHDLARGFGSLPRG